MESQSQQRPPRWINPLLILGAFFALVSVSLIATAGWKLGSHRHGELIADITVNLNGKAIREHCTTCHAYQGSLLFAKAGAPEKEHPDISPHVIEDMGCTGCHLGEGMALDLTISHGLPGVGARKVLKGADLQASCYRCHEVRPLKGAEQAWKGYQLFDAKPCGLCHAIAILGGGGYYGPDLSDIGSQLGLGKLQEAIRDPRKDPEKSIMPRFPLSRRQTKQISYFLKAQVEDPFYTTPMIIQTGKSPLLPCAAQEPEPIPLSGPSLLETKKCLGCHKFKDRDGQIGPDQTFLGAMRPASYILNFLKGPASLIPGSIMPTVPMRGKEKRILISFLEREASGPVDASDPKLLYMAVCQRCHAAAGDGYGTIQPNLANFPRAFAGNKGFFRTISDQRIVRSLEKGIPGTSMPSFCGLLKKKDQEGLMQVVFGSFIGTDREDKVSLLPVPQRPSPLERGKQAQSVFEKACARCHGKGGTGTGPEHLRHLPRPRNLTNHPYFASLGDERVARAILDGVPGTAMPAFRGALEAGRIWDLVGQVRTFSRTLDKEMRHES